MPIDNNIYRKLVNFLFSANLLFIAGSWYVNLRWAGYPGNSRFLIEVGNLFALFAGFFILIQLLLLSRSIYLENIFGIQRLSRLHKLYGYLILACILFHVVLTTIGYELYKDNSFFGQIYNFMTSSWYLLAAFIGVFLLICLGLTTAQSLRSRLKYEAWYYTHLLSYIAVALIFWHEILIGSDILLNKPLLYYWLSINLITLVIIFHRLIRPFLLYSKHQFRVERVAKETWDTYSVYIKGKSLDTFTYKAGQFVNCRFLTKSIWAQEHPFSLSDIPNGSYVRITVKSVGDYTQKVRNIKPGTKVLLDNPRGHFTEDRLKNHKPVLIAGGSGITAVYPVLCAMAKTHKKVVLLYACKTPRDVVYKNEIERLKKNFKVEVHLFFNDVKRGSSTIDEFTLKKILSRSKITPDFFICGPKKMMAHICEILKRYNVDPSLIHTEEFKW
jgi:predicted ferric reductase